jgi:hypothetical protein
MFKPGRFSFRRSRSSSADDTGRRESADGTEKIIAHPLGSGPRHPRFVDCEHRMTSPDAQLKLR